MNLTIRPVASGDVADVTDVAELAWEPVFASFRHVLGAEIYSLLYPDWRQRQRDAAQEVCAEGSGMVVHVAEVDGVIVGFIAYEINLAEASGEVDLLAVRPDHQNRGIGTALTVFALDEMKQRGVRLAVVATGGDPGHAPARRTYEKAGYTALPLVRYYKAL